MNEKNTNSIYNLFDKYCRECHKIAKEKGFWESKNIPEKLMLINSELCEALEQLRNQNITEFNVEIADVFIRLFDLCGYLEIPIKEYIDSKIELNKTRAFKHGKAF
jgi:NTP pyrophosphatase (non-canonical NTP hydrolase)